MNVGSFGFNFGNIRVDVAGLNGEQATGSLTITSPIKDFTILVKLHSGRNWSQLRSWSVEVDLTENPKPKEEEDTSGDIPFEDDEEERDDDA